MRKHKNLNKQELMIRQDIPCVHLGGKFVPLKSRVKSVSYTHLTLPTT